MKIYYSRLDQPLSEVNFNRYLNQMPIKIKSKILRYKNWEDAHSSLIGKILLQEGLKDAGMGKVNLSELEYNAFKRPYFSGKIDFNISHSGTLVVCAINLNAKVGIDVEKIEPINTLDFYDCWTANEKDVIYRNPNDYFTFYKFWTKKEAIVKAIGNGLNIPLKDIEITHDFTVVNNYGNWYLKKLQIFNDYVVHLATNKECDFHIDLIQRQYS